MSNKRATITGVAAYLPPDILDNYQLEKMVDTSDEWIQSRTGIKERRILKEQGLASSDMGAEAVKALLLKKQLQPTDIDLLICATVTPDMPFPSTANIICDKTGIVNIGSFDVSAACSGFIYALTIASKFVESGASKRVIVVGADKMSSIIDYEDRATCILFGDAAAAVLVEPSNDGTGIVDSILRSDGSGKQYLHQKAGGSAKPASHETVDAKEHFVYQDGKQVYRFAVKGMASVTKEIMTKNGLKVADIDWIVPHQANKRIIDSMAKMMDFPLEKVMLNIHKYGNTTAATIPLCLWEWESKLKKGDQLILTAFGGGFTWGAMYLTWGNTH